MATFLSSIKHGFFDDAINFLESGYVSQEDINYAGSSMIIRHYTEKVTKEKIRELMILLHDKYNFDVSSNNNNAIKACFFNDDPEMINLLIELGADVHTDNDSLFINCCRYGCVNNVKFLLDYVDLSKNECTRALTVSASHGHIDVVSIFLELGIDPNVNDTDALICSSYLNQYEITKLLLQYGADVNAQNDAALLNATLRRNYDIVELLLSHGANVRCFEATPHKNIDIKAKKVYDMLVSVAANPLMLATILYSSGDKYINGDIMNKSGLLVQTKYNFP